MAQMVNVEVEDPVGPKRARVAAGERAGHGQGTTTRGEEIALDTRKVLSSADLLNPVVVEHTLAGVATRWPVDVAEPLGYGLDCPGSFHLQVSGLPAFREDDQEGHGRFAGQKPRGALRGCLHDCDLDVAGQCCMVALVITIDGTEVPVGLWLGDTENKTVVTDLLADLVAREFDTTGGVLCVIDGAKSLAAGIVQVFGEHAVVQSYTIHKRRNVAGHLPNDLAATVDSRPEAIFAQPDTAKGLAAARHLANELEVEHPDAAGSLKEGLADMSTVRRLGVGGALARTLTYTSCIESMISVPRRTTGRVTRAGRTDR